MTISPIVASPYAGTQIDTHFNPFLKAVKDNKISVVQLFLNGGYKPTEQAMNEAWFYAIGSKKEELIWTLLNSNLIPIDWKIDAWKSAIANGQAELLMLFLRKNLIPKQERIDALDEFALLGDSRPLSVLLDDNLMRNGEDRIDTQSINTALRDAISHADSFSLILDYYRKQEEEYRIGPADRGSILIDSANIPRDQSMDEEECIGLLLEYDNEQIHRICMEDRGAALIVATNCSSTATVRALLEHDNEQTVQISPVYIKRALKIAQEMGNASLILAFSLQL